MTKTPAVKTGYILCILLALFDLTSILAADTNGATGGETGPPLEVAIIAVIVGAATLGALWFAWRGDLRALWVVVITRIVSALLGIPAFFADVSTGVKILVAAGIVVTAVAIWLVSPGLRKAQRVS